MTTRSRRSLQSSESPILTARRVPEGTRIFLCVRTGGRCEFDDCNEYLFEHHVTRADGLYAEVAHIVAFKPDGPRGSHTRPQDVHAIENLMLLCPRCHKLIDDHPDRFTRETLQRFKNAHEEHIRRVTGLPPEKRTAVLVVQATIGEQRVAIPPAHIFEAVSPRYPISKNGTVVDLSHIDEGPASIQAATEAITKKMRWLVESSDSDLAKTQHLSVFALAPMPVLMFLGRQLSDKVPTDLFQRHRDTETWTWKEESRPPVRYLFRQLQQGTASDKVGLVLSLSGVIGRERWPAEFEEAFSVYEIALADEAPSTGFLRTRADLEGFRRVYQAAIEAIATRHGILRDLHVLPAVPAPIAIICGRERLPKAHPALVVYDYDKTRGGFAMRLRVQ
jgi:hypothetical protein